MDQRDDALGRLEAEQLANGVVVERMGGAPVVRETARGGAEQHGVHRARSGVEILLVGLGVAREQRCRENERGRTAELRSLFLADGLLERGARLSAEDTKPPRLGEVVIGGPAREVEQL